MENEQGALFGDDLTGQPETDGLILLSRPSRPLTGPQRTFNRLVKRVEKLRGDLERETHRLNDALAYYGEHLQPRLVRQIALRKDLVREFATFLSGGRLRQRRDRQTLQKLIAEQLEIITDQGGALIEDDLRALFEEVYGVGIEEAERQGMEQTRQAMEAMFDEFGIDMDLSDMRPDMSVEEMAAKAAEMADKLRQKAETEEAGHQGRRKSKRQVAKEEQLKQAELIRKKSIATIYKQLAKVLHPDLEQNPEYRQGKVELMQELTAAYRNNDLHTLLRLELEWIQREEGDLERLTDEKLSIYNQVLKEQVQELELELENLPLHPRYEPLQTAGPFEVHVQTNGAAEAKLIDRTNASLEVKIASLRGADAIDSVRTAIRTYRAQNRNRFQY